MRLQFWQTSAAPQKLSDQVQRALTAQFRVKPDSMDDLRQLSKGGRFSSRKVHLIRIFDPSLIEGTTETPVRYNDLMDQKGHRKALLFEGHIEKEDFRGRVDKDNQVFLSDLRAG